MFKKKKLTKFQIIILAIFLLSVLGLKLWHLHWPDAVIGLAGQELNVLVAKTPYHTYKGLSGRESLGSYDGMLFLFYSLEKPTMVMRDMEFPIDIVWLDYGEVVDIAPNVPVEPNAGEAELTKYYPRKEANLVLELPAGWTEEYDLKIGDRMNIISE